MQTSTLSQAKSMVNVSAFERILMTVAGSYILYKGLSQEKKNIGHITSGSAMLVRGISGYCPAYSAVNHLKNDKGSNVNIRTKITIDKPISEVYAFWRNLENLPKFMNHLESVKTLNSTQSEWTAKGPAGIGSLSWKAEIIKDHREKLLSWQSIEDAPVKNFGKVLFKASANITEIEVTISYRAPLGIAGQAAAKLLNPIFKKIVRDDIKGVKTYLETK